MAAITGDTARVLAMPLTQGLPRRWGLCLPHESPRQHDKSIKAGAIIGRKQSRCITFLPCPTRLVHRCINRRIGEREALKGGEAFRPTINSYLYANALAISKIAAIKRRCNKQNI
jgi:hypothetical protein